tara:strand:- start:203 stop:487 length:285 start_codon:yes stop_codon:yes gene_type:complete
MARKPNKETREQYKKCASFGCVVCAKIYGCENTECEIHHLTGAGLGLRNEKEFFGLCYRHHRGEDGVHHNTKIFEERFGTQKDLLLWYKEKNNV